MKKSAAVGDVHGGNGSVPDVSGTDRVVLDLRRANGIVGDLEARRGLIGQLGGADGEVGEVVGEDVAVGNLLGGDGVVLQRSALTGCRVHVQHVSSEAGVEMIRRAKERGLDVSAEVTAHHLTFTDEALRDYDPRFKCNPPLREESDRAALRRGVMDGTIDVIVSDHFPHTRVATDVEFDRAPFGVAGLETVVSASYAVLVEEGGWSLGSFVRALSSRPREILGLPVPTLSVGEWADLTVLDLDPHETGVHAPDDLLNGNAILTIVSGKIVYGE